MQDVPHKTIAEIGRDVPRSYPEYWCLACDEGQAAMSRLLRAYAAADSEVGYCQGMNFVAGLLLMYVPEESQAFGIMHALLVGRDLRMLYTPDMAGLQV